MSYLKILIGELNSPRGNFMTLLDNFLFSGKFEFAPSKGNFPVNLHYHCNIVRNLGIIEPHRKILRYFCPQFRKMTPHGVDNYCGVFAVISQNNFKDWRISVSGRKKSGQI
jgi:Fe-S oxidoreductase